MSRPSQSDALSALLRKPQPRAANPPDHTPLQLIRPVRRLRRRWLPWALFGALLGCAEKPKMGRAPTPQDKAAEALLVETVADAIEPVSSSAAPRPRS